MSSGFKMKRSRSPDPIGIDNYKKQRLIYDFENLSLAPRGTDGIKKHKIDSGLNSFKAVVNKRMWDVVERELSGSNKNDKIYERIFDHVRQFNSQVIKWYDWRSVVASLWVKWYQQHSPKLDEVDMNVETAADSRVDLAPNLMHRNDEFDHNADMDIDMDLDTDPYADADMDIELDE
ncbi:uncharacterized protein KLLA0_E23343g [Kluyveromyces lactis]|uniref:KLLA0E23343p n=1 Tax=Kluyveromyces lactis (strain ATCC 8585 / CBS 2359 / DSM 70799 / NBRC 1267 / NRRL Y-1140 / WM37) TaxID=284590 RepID=Q6CM34_KLULA|nr:uncharacterized protein KLLA0_E23343g [Kluyveromyces lactis]CAH00092.1 KLLA0E23343p [Kluyveromyces lactis]|eukprot:XP_455005.1 uncharacterized protein KLLA0_E23343g [Kluyveromyces lactis]